MDECLGNCANCGNTYCEWYDDWMDGYDDWMDEVEDEGIDRD